VRASAEAHEADPSLASFLSALPIEMSRHEEIRAAMMREPQDMGALFAQTIERANLGGGVTDEAALSMFLACTIGLSLYAATLAEGGGGDAIRAFASLIDGKLFRVPNRRR
jgi:hypothetical protein